MTRDIVLIMSDFAIAFAMLHAISIIHVTSLLNPYNDSLVFSVWVVKHIVTLISIIMLIGIIDTVIPSVVSKNITMMYHPCTGISVGFVIFDKM